MWITGSIRVEPLLWHPASRREWNLLQDSTPYGKEIADLPLGVIAGTSYSQTAVRVDTGDLLILYTDGLNASCDESGEQLGIDRLLEMARGLPTDSAGTAARALLAAVERFRGTIPAADDVTVVVLERHAEAR